MIYTKISGDCDNDRLEKVLSILDKKAQQSLSEKRRSTLINKQPSEYEGVITQDVIDYYESITNNI